MRCLKIMRRNQGPEAVSSPINVTTCSPEEGQEVRDAPFAPSVLMLLAL